MQCGVLDFCGKYVWSHFLKIKHSTGFKCDHTWLKGKNSQKKKKVSLSTSDIDNFCPVALAGLYGNSSALMGGQIKPKIPEFVAMAVTKLAWTEEYATEKITPVMTRWQISQNNASQNDENCSTSKYGQWLKNFRSLCFCFLLLKF